MPGVYIAPSQSQIHQEEQRLRSNLADRATRQIADIETRDDVHVRDILPEEDLDVDDNSNVNGWNGTDREWLQAGLTADQLEQVYEIDSGNNADNKIIGIVAVSNISNDPSTSEIVFEAGTGGRFERLQMQGIETETTGEFALLTDPVIFNAEEDGVIYQWPTTGGDDNVVYHGAVAESKENTLARRRA